MKKGNSAECRRRRAKAIDFCKEHEKRLSRKEIATKLIEKFGYSYGTALILVSEAKRIELGYNENTGKGLIKFLQSLEEREQKAYERKKARNKIK